MKFLQLNKVRVVYCLLAFMFTFKLLAIQEYIHAGQHIKEHNEHKNNEDCQLCSSIFGIGKYQPFISADFPEFYCNFITSADHLDIVAYIYRFVKNYTPQELNNRPPPYYS